MSTPLLQIFPCFSRGITAKSDLLIFIAGIDIKTEQIEGKNVTAAYDGHIYRIVVQTRRLWQSIVPETCLTAR